MISSPLEIALPYQTRLRYLADKLWFIMFVSDRPMATKNSPIFIYLLSMLWPCFTTSVLSGCLSCDTDFNPYPDDGGIEDVAPSRRVDASRAQRESGSRDLDAYVVEDVSVPDAGMDRSQAELDAESDSESQPQDALQNDAIQDAEADTGDAIQRPSEYCGDAIRDPVTEECDDGPGDQEDSCTSDCRMRNQLVVESTDADDAGVPDIRYRRLGRGRHPAAAGRDFFTIVYLETGDVSEMVVAVFDKWGRIDGLPLDMNAHADVTNAADPVIAALPDNRFALAWSDRSNGTLDIAVRLVVPEQDTQPLPIVVNTTLSGPQQDPDILWTGQELIVAWSDNFDLKYRRFSEQLLALDSEQVLANTSAVEGLVTLERFADSWAAGWRAGEAGMERVVVCADDTSWETEPFPPGPEGDHPALVALDDEHLLLVFTRGTDPLDLGVFNVGRLRMALLDLASPGSVESIPLVPMTPPFDNDETLAQRRPTAVRVGERIYIAWETESPLGDPLRSELWLQEVSVSLGSPDTVNQLEERALPVTAPQSGDQENPVLAASSLYPEGALIAVWEDKSGAYGDWPSPELVLGFRPSPFVDLPISMESN